MALANGTNTRAVTREGGVGGVGRRGILAKDKTAPTAKPSSGRIIDAKITAPVVSSTNGISNGQKSISPRSVLYPGDELSGDDNYLRSPNGRYEAVFTSEGAVEVYLTAGKSVGDRSVIIHSRRLRSGKINETPLRWRMNENGHFVALATDDSVFFSTEMHVDSQLPVVKGPRKLEIRDDGNVVLYHGDDNQVWRTTTGEQSQWSIEFLYTYGSKSPGLGLLKQGSTIYNGDYLAKLENDGRLCVYQFEHDLNGTWKCEKCVWSSHGGGGAHAKPQSYAEPFRLFVQADGDVVVKDGQNVVVWRTRTKGKIKKAPALFQLTEDGRLQLKDGDDRVVWLSGDDGHPKQNG